MPKEMPTKPTTIAVKKTNRYKKVKSILLSQPKPERSPYFELETKFNVTVDWRPFIQVEGYTEKEFRRQRIRHDEYPNVIFTSKSAIENYFRLAEEMRFKINEMNKYFCATEAIANYLQKFIIFRKRKVFNCFTIFTPIESTIVPAPFGIIILYFLLNLSISFIKIYLLIIEDAATL